jgi:glycerol-3-phosphate dehydrogenase
MAVPAGRQNWLSSGVYDLIVVGGGINGAGIARDAAQRGMSVALLEKNDFSSGTTQAPTRLIHGGLRYLEYFEFSLVFESLQEREILLHVAPHLVHPLPFVIPIYAHHRRGPLLVNLGMLGYDILSFNKSLPRYRRLSAAQVRELEPGLDPDGLRGGVLYYDAQVDWPERLCLANALSARQSGAYVRNYSEVIGFLGNPRSVEGVHVRETLTGREYDLRSRLVVNASGPWADRLLQLRDPSEPRRVLGAKGIHVLVQPFPGAPRHAIYIEARSDGRPYFVVPWAGALLIGTTDDPYSGDLDDVRPNEAEARYLLAEVNQVFPAARLSTEDVHHAYAGVRALPVQRGKSTDTLSRRSFIHDHAKEEGVRGLVSIIGGKLTAYRHLAEEVVDHAQSILRIRDLKPCRTRNTALPGGELIDLQAYIAAQLPTVASRFELQAQQVEHLIRLYGTHYTEVLALVEQKPELGTRLVKGAPDIAAQAAYAVEREMAQRLSDFFVRRSGLVTRDSGSDTAISLVARIFAERLKWDEAQTAREISAWRAERARLFTLQTGGVAA